jgi:hypothetical protein
MRFAAEIRANQLERNDAFDEYVASAIHDAHAAFAETRFETIATGNHFAEHRIVRTRTPSTPLCDRLFHALFSAPRRTLQNAELGGLCLPARGVDLPSR